MTALLDTLAEAPDEDRAGDHRDRHVDPEDHRPDPMRGDEGADHWADQRGGDEDARDDTLQSRTFFAVEDVADHRPAHRHKRAGAEPLEHAEYHQRQHAPGEAAEYRAENEKADADQEDGLTAVKIGE